MSTLTLESHIVSTPDVRFGKPHIDGTRIAVLDVAFWYVYQKMSVDQIASDYSLSLAQVHAALTYYYDHKDEIDREIANETELHAKLKAQSQTKLAKILREQENQVLS